MSNKLAKVLVICALVVVLPLFVAGTVIAVYNSLNSTINVEVYTGEKEEGEPIHKNLPSLQTQE